MLLLVGRLGKPHGIRGMLTVEVRTDDPEERFAPGSVLITEPAERGPLTVSARRWQNDRLVVAFADVTDRNAAEELRGTQLWVDSDDVATPDDDTFADHELVGLAVVRMAGEPIGEVVDVLHGPAGETLVISHDGREVLVPFVTAIVPVVDLEARKLVIDPPDGLLEL